MRFVADAQLPPDLARFLREQGHEARRHVEVTHWLDSLLLR